MTKEGNTYGMNSCHHQMCYPYDLPTTDYEVLAWTEGLSDHYTADVPKKTKFPKVALDDKGVFKEPEMIWYPKTNCLGVQGHPEWQPGKPAMDFINKIILEKLDEKESKSKSN